MAPPQVPRSAGLPCRLSYRIVSKCQYPERSLVLAGARSLPRPGGTPHTGADIRAACERMLAQAAGVLAEAADEVRNQPVPVGRRDERRPHARPREAEADRL